MPWETAVIVAIALTCLAEAKAPDAGGRRFGSRRASAGLERFRQSVVQHERSNGKVWHLSIQSDGSAVAEAHEHRCRAVIKAHRRQGGA
jgi:hypothetical protein